MTGTATAQVLEGFGEGLVGGQQPLGGGNTLLVYGGHLYVGGQFGIAADTFARMAVRYGPDGWRWLGTGAMGSTTSLALFDDGTAPALYVSGQILNVYHTGANLVARWDGSTWSPVGDLTNSVDALAGGVGLHLYGVFDDGTGPALQARGFDVLIGDDRYTGILRWDGASWEPLPRMSGGIPRVMFNDGSGPAIYGIAPNGSAGRWTGAEWAALGSGQIDGWVMHLVVYDDGSGPALHAIGNFTSIGGTPALGAARWDGAAWHALGGGLTRGRDVHDAVVHDDGAGPALYVIGFIDEAEGRPTPGLARWDGTAWSDVGGSLPRQNGVAWGPHALEVFDDGRGPALYAAGRFSLAGSTPVRNIARWDGAGWEPLGELRGTIIDLQTMTHGAAPSLVAAGELFGSDPFSSPILARWLACPACPADFDGSGAVDPQDFAAVLAAYRAGDLRADFDGSGALTLNDFVAFRNAFVRGCD